MFLQITCRICAGSLLKRFNNLGKHGISAYASKLLRCSVLATSLYTAYYLGFCVPCALHFISLGDLFRVSLVNFWACFSIDFTLQ